MPSLAKLSQRWSSSTSDSLTAVQTPRRLARGDNALISWRRLGVECLVLLLLLSWGITMTVVLSSSFSQCRTLGPLRHVDRFVNFQTQYASGGSGHWQIGVDGLLGVSATASRNASWVVEWQPELKGWFCLRWLQPGPFELRLLEAVAPSSDPPWVLRAGRYGCHDDSQLFTFRGRSLYSKTVGSYINLRSQQHLRTHGDVFPWKPLTKETRQTYLLVDAFPELPVDTSAHERRLLAFIAAREVSASIASGLRLATAASHNPQQQLDAMTGVANKSSAAY